MPLKLYNTLGREKQVFEPQDPDHVTLYVCGPTVYNYAHIGNARPPVVFDVLFRLLRRTYGEASVLYARNITDVEDKIIARSLEEGTPIDEITQKYAAIYNADMAALNVLPPSIEPWATKHIDGMVRLTQQLVNKGYAYPAASGVFFDVSQMEDYGKLSGRNIEDNEAGARVAVSDEKRNPADFALWKLAKEGEPEDATWDSPWGPGRPGWHIECSAMIAAHLGKTIDIHAGGIDLQFPHHENEIAQSECAHGEPMARYWLHNGFLDMDGEKMSKSLGNVKLIHDLIEDWPGEVLRFALLSGHYRAPLDWTRDLLEQSKTTLGRIYGALRRVWEAEGGEASDKSIDKALNDDLNTPVALAELSRLASEANLAADAKDAAKMAKARAELLAAGEKLGLLAIEPEAWFGGMPPNVMSTAQKLVEARNQARAKRQWSAADDKKLEMQRLWFDVQDGRTTKLNYLLKENVMPEVLLRWLSEFDPNQDSLKHFRREPYESISRHICDLSFTLDRKSFGFEFKRRLDSRAAKHWISRSIDRFSKFDYMYYLAGYEGKEKNFSISTILQFQKSGVGLGLMLGTGDIVFMSDPAGLQHLRAKELGPIGR